MPINSGQNPKNHKQQNQPQVYCCPKCDQILAVGQIVSMVVVCHQCGEYVNYNRAKGRGEIAFPAHWPDDAKSAVRRPIGNGYLKQTYGRDKLTIAEMHATRKECLAAGHSHYFTGKPCKYGHIAPRTKKGGCNECQRIYFHEYKARDPEKVRRASRESRRRINRRKAFLDQGTST